MQFQPIIVVILARARNGNVTTSVAINTIITTNLITAVLSECFLDTWTKAFMTYNVL